MPDEIKHRDLLHYLPHECHALHPGPGGVLPWVLGRVVRGRRRSPVPPDAPLPQDHRNARGARRTQAEPPEPAEQVSEMTGRDAAEFLDWVRRQPDVPRAFRENLRLLRPARPWPAVVRAVNDDGTVDIDTTPGNGVILHYDAVPHRPEKDLHHTVHRPDLGSARAGLPPDAGPWRVLLEGLPAEQPEERPLAAADGRGQSEGPGDTGGGE